MVVQCWITHDACCFNSDNFAYDTIFSLATTSAWVCGRQGGGHGLLFPRWLLGWEVASSVKLLLLNAFWAGTQLPTLFLLSIILWIMFTEFNLHYWMKKVIIISVRAQVIRQALLSSLNEKVPYRLYKIEKSGSGALWQCIFSYLFLSNRTSEV